MSKKLPSVTSDIPRDLRTFIDRLREIISGSGNDRLVSVQDLVNGGIAGPGSNGTLVPAPTTGTVQTPPAPANVSATGGVYSVFVEWDNPTYYGHDYTEVFSGATDVIGDAVLLGFTPGVNYVDTIGPSQSRYYWARFVNTQGVKGPFNSVSGTLGTTTVEVAHILDVLTGAITETELYTDLGNRIDLVDTTNGGLINKYTVKIDSNGYVSGFGLASTTNNATPYSDFIIRADRFSIASPSGPGITPVIPFVVTTTPTVINGVTVNPGVYINGAYIQGGSIQGASIAGGTIENTKLINVSADKITGAALEATSYIESAAYIAGSQGWKIHGNGFAEFGAASIRGQLTASQINSNGLSIRDTNGTIILNAGTGAFTGNVTGTISGTAASTVVSNASTALTTANTANTNANTAISGLANKLNSDARNILAGSGGLATGTLNWNTSGVRTSGSGVGLTANGLVAYNSSGVATFALNGSTGAASFAGDITAGTVGGSSVGSTYVRSANYVSGSSGWNISSNGNAEFNEITVRSGQIIGALAVAYKVQSTLSLYVEISGGNGISTTNGPYYLNGGSPPQYLVYSNYMPANATAAHKIAVSVNVQSTGYGNNKDLSVLILINASISGSTIYASEQIAYNTNSGVYGLATNATGVSTNTYSTAVPVMIFVGGYNAAYTIQTVDGIAWGVR